MVFTPQKIYGKNLCVEIKRNCGKKMKYTAVTTPINTIIPIQHTNIQKSSDLKFIIKVSYLYKTVYRLSFEHCG